MSVNLSTACAALGVALVVSGCAGFAESPRTGTVHYVEIREQISPQVLTVSIDDEIQWKNLSAHPVRLAFLGGSGFDHISCQRGFSWLGFMQEFVVIQPGQHVSLCFSDRGLVHYNVWMDADDLRGSISRTATIKVERAS